MYTERLKMMKKKKLKTEGLTSERSSSFVVGFDPSSVTEKTITKSDGGSVWRIGDGFGSVVSFDFLREGEHEVSGEERKKKILNKKNFPYPADTRL